MRSKRGRERTGSPIVLYEDGLASSPVRYRGSLMFKSTFEVQTMRNAGRRDAGTSAEEGAEIRCGRMIRRVVGGPSHAACPQPFPPLLTAPRVRQ